MRILSVRLQYLYSEPAEEGATTQPPIEKRRDTLSNLGFDVTKIDDDQLKSYPVLGMTDAQFVELTIAGEKDMAVVATCVID